MRRQIAVTTRGLLSNGSRTLHLSRSPWVAARAACWSARTYSTGKTSPISIQDRTFESDPAWCNISSTVLSAASRRLHLQKDHPVSITRQIIESHFPSPTFRYHNQHHPVVSTQQNFDSLGFPTDHPGRALTDTYYINEKTLLRTHTSAHQADTFKANESPGYLISADVYRRDAIDRSHYPAFHQMEGARAWDRNVVPNGDIAAAVLEEVEALPKHDIVVEDANPAYHEERNPLQSGHYTAAEAEAISLHLKRSLELVFIDIFTRAKEAAKKADPNFKDEPLKMRWIEAYFPFTSPSYELEVYYNGDWLEVLGSGVVQQDLYNNAGVPSKSGWAFGLGLDRIAMLLFHIPDIRLFWSKDERFLSQFRGISDNLSTLKRFAPFSRYPPCPLDVSFWVKNSVSAAGGNTRGAFHENDVMELVRDVAGDNVEDVTLFDDFTHPKTGKRSVAYRIVYRSLERTLTKEEAVKIHDDVRARLESELGVELR